jgi:hypothetical protein
LLNPPRFPLAQLGPALVSGPRPLQAQPRARRAGPSGAAVRLVPDPDSPEYGGILPAARCLSASEPSTARSPALRVLKTPPRLPFPYLAPPSLLAPRCHSRADAMAAAWSSPVRRLGRSRSKNRPRQELPRGKLHTRRHCLKLRRRRNAATALDRRRLPVLTAAKPLQYASDLGESLHRCSFSSSSFYPPGRSSRAELRRRRHHPVPPEEPLRPVRCESEEEEGHLLFRPPWFSLITRSKSCV